MCKVDGTQAKEPLRKRLTGYAELLLVFWGVGGILVGSGLAGLWWLGGEKLTATAQTALGVTDLSERVEEVAQIGRQNGEALAKLKPQVTVAEYDSVRSKVFKPCVRGGSCDYQIRARRTHTGVECGRPSVIARIVTDSTGLQYPVETSNDRRTVRVGGEWTMVRSTFQTPKDAPLGVAEFHMELEYPCDGETVAEESAHLIFQLVDEANP